MHVLVDTDTEPRCPACGEVNEAWTGEEVGHEPA
jgi:hypothetical protein